MASGPDLAGVVQQLLPNVLAMTSRSMESKEDSAHDLSERLTALGRAHDLVRPVSGRTRNATLLGDLIFVLQRPDDDLSAFSSRIRVFVPRMGIRQAATVREASAAG